MLCRMVGYSRGDQSSDDTVHTRSYFSICRTRIFTNDYLWVATVTVYARRPEILSNFRGTLDLLQLGGLEALSTRRLLLRLLDYLSLENDL